jgi:hypothetical protein
MLTAKDTEDAKEKQKVREESRRNRTSAAKDYQAKYPALKHRA